MISYAGALEDVLLHRAIHHVPHHDGFYIDVGAYHPHHDSVTKHFYDHGWRGINIEPSPDLFAPFVAERTRDINLQAAISSKPGEVTFYQVDGQQLGTLEKRHADRHASHGFGTRSCTVPAMTLTQVCEQHAPPEIHFLKIDVEGHEAGVLEGMDFKRFRPWIMVIESTHPNTGDPSFQEWEHIVLPAGYRFAYTDVLNRYYVANEHLDLMQRFAVGPDRYQDAKLVKEVEQLRMDLADTRRELEQVNRSRVRESA